ncbi:MAG: tyrosine-type recombinase/integrase [Sphaerochaeta sp.]|jgi:site-specific recombinase XerD|nr:tyrosine-type recombinase/integrase [Sphaerochaeta sp.]
MTRKLPKYLTDNQLKQLLAYVRERASATPRSPNQRYYAETRRVVIELLLFSGLRCSELCALNVGDLGDDHVLTVRHGKGDKERYIGLADPVAELVESYTTNWFIGAGPDEPMLRSLRTRRRLLRSDVWRIVSQTCRRAGLPHVWPHRIRHSAATHMLSITGDIAQVSEFLGHASIDTTKIYAKITHRTKLETARACYIDDTRNEGDQP